VKILFLGDVYGPPGRRALKSRLAALKDRLGADVTVVNGENAADGFGLMPAHAVELVAAGADLITTGDHAFDKRELMPALATETRVIRPLNYPDGAPGRGSAIIDTRSGKRMAVLNLQGRVFMFKQTLDDPFPVARREVESLKAQTPVVLVDFHAEATSEKVAMGWWLDGLASAVIGTHTHIQTADERILPKGTAYLTDAGMCGPVDSVLGIRVDRVLARFTSQLPSQWAPADGAVRISGALIEVDETTGRAIAITRVNELVEPGA